MRTDGTGTERSLLSALSKTMTREQKIEWGTEIIAGMKASANSVSLEEGRRLVADGMHTPAVKRAVETQAIFIAEVAMKRLSMIEGVFDFVKHEERDVAAHVMEDLQKADEEANA